MIERMTSKTISKPLCICLCGLCIGLMILTEASAQQVIRFGRPIIQSSQNAANGSGSGTTSAFKLPRLKYGGGGDWYNDPSAEVNLLRFVQEQAGIRTEPTFEFVELGSDNIFLYPMLFMTGHGTVSFTEPEVKRLRAYLENGGFLYIDDDYGMDASVRRELKKVFPEQTLAELPFSHGVYHALFPFPNGVPKTHDHDGKTAQGFGLFYKERLCVYYTYESNPSDGWADKEVHNDPPAKREEALKFGANIIVWALTQ
jgi:hypothetical protein